MKYGSGNMSTISGSSNKTSRPQLINYGERLYQKGLKRKEELERRIREAKSHKELQQQDEFSFKPEINEISKLMVQRHGERTED